jgi:hypothetical protein
MAKTLHFNPAQLLAAGFIGMGLALPLAASANNFNLVPALVKASLVVALTPEQSIANKAVSLGAAFTGAAVSGLETVPGGFRIRYQHCDIYYSTTTGAHEVHGDIRAKYNYVNGPATLGLPTTDERTAADKIGRYNHFANEASIYWKPNTGPMVVKGDVRWGYGVYHADRGAKGYPTIDTVVLGLNQAYGDFENDVIYMEGPAEVTPELAVLSPAQVKRAISNHWWAHTFDLGQMVLENVSITHVSNPSYGFLQSRNRSITFHLKGKWVRSLWFDSDWTMDIHVLFFWLKETDGSTSLRMRLLGQKINASDSVEAKVEAQLGRCFNSRTKLIAQHIPATVPVLSFKVREDGSLGLYLQPIAGAVVAGRNAQNALNAAAK